MLWALLACNNSFTSSFPVTETTNERLHDMGLCGPLKCELILAFLFKTLDLLNDDVDRSLNFFVQCARGPTSRIPQDCLFPLTHRKGP